MRLLAIGLLCAAFFACRGERPDGEEQQSADDTEEQVPEQQQPDVEQPEDPGSSPAVVIETPGIEQPAAGGEVSPTPTLCREELCWEISSEKAISHVLVSLPCPELLADVEITDLGTGSKCGSHPPPQGDHDNCGLSLTGLKLDDVEATDIELCIRTSQPVSPNAITIAIKSDGECLFIQTATEEVCGCQ